MKLLGRECKLVPRKIVDPSDINSSDDLKNLVRYADTCKKIDVIVRVNDYLELRKEDVTIYPKTEKIMPTLVGIMINYADYSRDVESLTPVKLAVTSKVVSVMESALNFKPTIDKEDLIIVKAIYGNETDRHVLARNVAYNIIKFNKEKDSTVIDNACNIFSILESKIKMFKIDVVDKSTIEREKKYCAYCGSRLLSTGDCSNLDCRWIY